MGKTVATGQRPDCWIPLKGLTWNIRPRAAVSNVDILPGDVSGNFLFEKTLVLFIQTRRSSGGCRLVQSERAGTVTHVAAEPTLCLHQVRIPRGVLKLAV